VTGQTFTESRVHGEDIEKALDAAHGRCPVLGQDIAMIAPTSSTRSPTGSSQVEMIAIAEAGRTASVPGTLAADPAWRSNHLRYFAVDQAQEGSLSQIDEDTVAYIHEPLGWSARSFVNFRS